MHRQQCAECSVNSLTTERRTNVGWVCMDVECEYCIDGVVTTTGSGDWPVLETENIRRKFFAELLTA